MTIDELRRNGWTHMGYADVMLPPYAVRHLAIENGIDSMTMGGLLVGIAPGNLVFSILPGQLVFPNPNGQSQPGLDARGEDCV